MCSYCMKLSQTSEQVTQLCKATGRSVVRTMQNTKGKIAKRDGGDGVC